MGLVEDDVGVDVDDGDVDAEGVGVAVGVFDFGFSRGCGGGRRGLVGVLLFLKDDGGVVGDRALVVWRRGLGGGLLLGRGGSGLGEGAEGQNEGTAGG